MPHCFFIPASLDAALPHMQVSKEVEDHGDIVLVREKTNYKSILLKTFFVLEYAIKHYDVRFILKTDDDAYVHVEALVRQLRMLCISPDCRNERLYMGRMCTESEVLLQVHSVLSLPRRRPSCHAFHYLSDQVLFRQLLCALVRSWEACGFVALCLVPNVGSQVGRNHLCLTGIDRGHVLM